jgi:hypothetical protein
MIRHPSPRVTAVPLLALASLFALLAGGVPVAAQGTPAGAVTGHVRDAGTNRAVVGARVQVVETQLQTFTDADGRFALSDLDPGVYRLRVDAIGYAPYLESNVIVGSGKPLELTLRLYPQPVVLDPIAVRATYFTPPAISTTSEQRLGAVDTRRTPGVQEDVVRSVALLPGVGVTSGGRNDLVVRGGSPFENLFLIDGFEVPNINHFGSQGSTGGPLSLVNIELVEETRFASGGFGARYGDRTASVTEITLREGSTDGLSGTVNLSATGFGAIMEGPLGSRGSFLASARRSYLDLLFRAAGFSFIPAYWDFQLKTTHRIGDDQSLSFLVIGALDELSFNNEDEEDVYDNSRIIEPDLQQYVAGVSWNRALGRGQLSVSLGRTYTRYETRQTAFGEVPEALFVNTSTEGENSLRVEWAGQAGDRLDVSVGNVLKYASDLSYDVGLPGDLRRDASGVPSPLVVDTSFTALRNATYFQLTGRLTSGLSATAGLRASVYGFLGGSARLDPRLGARLDVGPRSTLSLSVGRYHQPPSYIWLVGAPANPDSLRPIRGDQITVGFETRPRDDLKLQVEGYYKRYRDYPARVFRPQAVLAPSGFEDATDDIPLGLEPLVSRGRGRVYGFEALARKKLSAIPIYGLVSASLSRSEFQGLEGESRPGRYDVRFIGTAAAGWRINSAWELGAKFRLATGAPSTPFIETGPSEGQREYANYNEGPRFPTFHSLDVRVDRRFSFTGWQLEVYVDIQNLYGRSNVSGVRWDSRVGEPEFDDSLGVLPTLGVNIEF